MTEQYDKWTSLGQYSIVESLYECAQGSAMQRAVFISTKNEYSVSQCVLPVPGDLHMSPTLEWDLGMAIVEDLRNHMEVL